MAYNMFMEMLSAHNSLVGEVDPDFVLPSHYGVKRALKDMYSSQELRGFPEHWLWNNDLGTGRGRLDVEGLAFSVENGAMAPSMMSCTRTDIRKAGKQGISYEVTRLIPDRFQAFSYEDGYGVNLDVVVARKEEIQALPGYLEERSGVIGLAVCRHALERYYERENCSQNDVRQRILNDLSQVQHDLGFAVSAGLFRRGSPFQHNAVSMLPLGDGLLVMRNAIVATARSDPPSSRLVRKKNKMFSTLTVKDPLRYVELEPFQFRDVMGFLMAIGVTYLSADLLNLEQSAYLSLFREEAARFDVETLSADMGRTWLAHEMPATFVEIEVQSRLHYLLSQICWNVTNWPMWFSKGWPKSHAHRKVPKLR